VKLQKKIAVRVFSLLLVGGVGMLVGCSSEHARPVVTPAPSASAVSVVDAGSVPPPTAEPEAPKAEAYRARLGLRGSELYVPAWFTSKDGRYDLVVHFHGEGRWQEENLEHAKLNVAVVSVNAGALGTDPYSNMFKDPAVFDAMLADVEAEMTKRGGPTPKLHRLALSAWSAGFSSVARLMTTDAVTDRVDAVLLADGFFTNFSDVKHRTVNKAGLERFVHFTDAARKNEKLFAITHTTIPTGPYPSVQECVNTLLELEHLSKKQCSIDGPEPKMHQFYKVDDGSFHIAGFKGVMASDHVRQLHAMGETTYPYLKARWEKQDAEASSGPTSSLK
jgi:hypothetical protein